MPELTSGPVGAVIPRMPKPQPPQSQVEQIANRLIASREALSLSAADLCRRSGIAPNTYSQWESANGRPSLDEAMKLCAALGYTLDWIYRGDPSGLPYQMASRLAGASSSRAG